MPVSEIVPARNADGRLELIATDQGGNIYHIWQIAPNGDFGGWASLKNAGWWGLLVTGTNADGRLEFFSFDTLVGLTWHIAQTTPNGNWGTWASLERLPSGDPLNQYTVGLNTNGLLELFAVDKPNGSLWHIWQVDPGGNWGGWANLSSPQAGAVPLNQCAVGRNANGLLEVFVVDKAKGTLWHIWQGTPGGNWGGWATLGNGVGIGPLVVGTNADGRLELFAADTAAGLAWHIWQTTPGGNWSDWQRLGDAVGVHTIAVANNADGRLELFAVDRDAALAWHIWQAAPNGGWGGWERLGDAAGLQAIAVANNADGRLELFAVDRNGGLSHIWQTAPNGDWGAWVTISDPNPPSPPPPLPAKIEYLNAEPNNGYVNLGTSATLNWQVTNTQADTKATLQGRVGLGGSGAVVFNKANVKLQGSQMVTPGEDTQYTLTVSDSRGKVSQAKWVTVYAPPTPPPGSVFYFKMTNPQSEVTPCFTLAIYAKDMATATVLAEQQNGGYTAASIDASQLMTACG